MSGNRSHAKNLAGLISPRQSIFTAKSPHWSQFGFGAASMPLCFVGRRDSGRRGGALQRPPAADPRFRSHVADVAAPRGVPATGGLLGSTSSLIHKLPNHCLHMRKPRLAPLLIGKVDLHIAGQRIEIGAVRSARFRAIRRADRHLRLRVHLLARTNNAVRTAKSCGASAADLKFLQRLPRVRAGTSNRKRHWDYIFARALCFPKFAKVVAAMSGELRKAGTSASPE
jgi:hypothetical protein